LTGLNQGIGTPSAAKRCFIASLSVANRADSTGMPGSPSAAATLATVSGTSEAMHMTPSSGRTCSW